MNAIATARRRIRVLIVDDSALVRSVLTQIIGSAPDLEVVAAVPDPLAAREKIRELEPDVLTLDVEMPKMDGLEFLARLMRLRPMPVLMISTLTERGSAVTLRALELGAFDFIPKPKLDVRAGLQGFADEIHAKIRAAARSRVRPRAVPQAPAPAALGNRRASTERLIVIGASTGGTEAIKAVLLGLPEDAPGVLVTQHMPAGFTRTFAERLDRLCRIAVKEAEHGEDVLPGHAYIAPGDRHLAVARRGVRYVTLLDDGPPVNRHRPSVEVLFRSAAQVAGANALGIMLTGMGRDGATAMRAMRDAGAYNVAQDEETSVVFGMPREAIAAGAVHAVLPLHEIAAHVLAQLGAPGDPGARLEPEVPVRSNASW